MASCIFAADTKVTDLAELTTVNNADVMYVVDDVAGTATSKKITVLNMFDTIDTSAKMIVIVTDETGTGALCFATAPTFTTSITIDAATVTATKVGQWDTAYGWGDWSGQGFLASSDINTFAEIDSVVADKALVNKADGAVWLGVHDLGGATSVELPNGTDPDVDALGEVSIDTDAGNEPNDVSMRSYDGTNQFMASQKIKHLNITLIAPADIAAADLIPVWHNTSGFTFHIEEIYAWSDTDDVSLELEEITSMTDFTSLTTVQAVEIATDGTSCFYSTYTVITHDTIETDHLLAIDFDTTDEPEYVKLTITGWFDANVD